MRAFAKRFLLHACRAVGLFALSDRLYRGRLLILCYHGFEVQDEAAFWPSMFMRRRSFRRRLQLLSRYGRQVLGLDEAVRRLAEGTLPAHPVVITIDDGFYSTLAVALPTLQRRRMPATLYLTSYYADNGRPVFNLALSYLLWKAPRRTVSLAGLEWAPRSEFDLADPGQREELLQHALAYGERRCDGDGREALAEELARRLGVDYAALRRQRLLSLLSHEEIAQLADAGIDVQLHTHRHRFPLDEAAARREILENRRFLDPLVGHACRHFCYPSGIYQPTQWPWLRQLGVVSATTCEAGFNTGATPPLGLKRFLDSENVSEIEFLAELSGFQDLLRRARAKLRTPRRRVRPIRALP